MKAVELYWGGVDGDDPPLVLPWLLPAPAARKAVQSPYCAWLLAGPVDGMLLLVVVPEGVPELEVVRLEVVGLELPWPCDFWWEAAVARPVAAWLLALDVWPGRDPVAAAAAVPRPKAATVAAAANLAVRTLDNIAFLLEWVDWSCGWESTSVAAAVTTERLRARSRGAAGPAAASNSAATPRRGLGASRGDRRPERSRS